MENNKEIKEATIEIVKMSQDEKIRKLAELREKTIMDEKEAFDAGKEDGIQQGELQTKINIARNMKNKKIDINIIVEVTGLTKEEIEKI